MKLNKALLAAGIGAATLLGGLVAGTPAMAAPANSTDTAAPRASEPRVIGAFGTWTQWDYTGGHGWSDNTGGTIKSVSHTPGSGARYTFPAKGYSGEIRSVRTGLCLTNAGSHYGAVTLQTCNGGTLQQWSYNDQYNTLRSGDGAGITDRVYLDSVTDLIRSNAGGLETLRTNLLTPYVESADPTASVISTDLPGKSAVVGGTGQPGATIVVTGPNGDVTVVVGQDGKWEATIPGLEFGDNVLPVRQIVNGEADKTTSVTVELEIADVTVALDALDNDAKTAHLVGTGQPGSTIEITNPNGDVVSTTVGADGKWDANVPGLNDGDNDLQIVQKTAGAADKSASLTVTIAAGPIANPMVAGGLALAAAAVAIPVMIRRRKTVTV